MVDGCGNATLQSACRSGAELHTEHIHIDEKNNFVLIINKHHSINVTLSGAMFLLYFYFIALINRGLYYISVDYSLTQP